MTPTMRRLAAVILAIMTAIQLGLVGVFLLGVSISDDVETQRVAALIFASSAIVLAILGPAFKAAKDAERW
ncbi:MAG: hypothetical protein KJS97_12530 [Alphaproteobacteria bacterium]|nr:hypothetical protein [Alphaproteobacteria bacterium]